MSLLQRSSYHKTEEMWLAVGWQRLMVWWRVGGDVESGDNRRCDGGFIFVIHTDFVLAFTSFILFK
jgi:hypothetical protein